MYKRGFKSYVNPNAGFEVVDYNRKYVRDNPDYFRPSGLTVFCGPQGSGKTYSAIVYVYTLMRRFKKAILVTNVSLFGVFDEFSDRILPYMSARDLSAVNNGVNGVIFLIDEIHLEFNSLESKNLPITLFTEISQQRKQRKHIVGMAQVYSRIAKPFREQMDTVVFCSCLLKICQINRVLDGTSICSSRVNESKFYGDVRKTYVRFHETRFYDSFDTYQKINRKRR